MREYKTYTKGSSLVLSVLTKEAKQKGKSSKAKKRGRPPKSKKMKRPMKVKSKKRGRPPKSLEKKAVYVGL